MNNKAIGVFDSGLGGLSSVRALREIMPHENIIYFGDTGRMPYGGRSVKQIREIAVQNVDFVKSKGVKAIIAACGTISSNAQDILANDDTEIIGVLKAGTSELCATGKKKLGVIATQTSIQSGSFGREILALCPDAELVSVACPKFVPMIESGHYEASDPMVQQVVAESLRELKEAGTEALLLGCTHYGLIGEAISHYLGEHVILVGAADAAARAMKAYLLQNGMQAENAAGESYYTSGNLDDFRKLAPVMLGYPLAGELSFVEPFPLED